jgi:acyl-CoA synthetase (NDP forming)
VPLVLEDPNVDALIVLFVPPVVAGAEDVAYAIREAVEGTQGEKPVLAAVMSADGTPAVLLDETSPVAALEYPESAARALGALADRAQWLRRPAGVVPELEDIDRAAGTRIVQAALETSSDGWLPADRARELLQAYGVPVVPELVATDEDSAVEAARTLGYPAVVKSAEAGAHKTERGGVALDLRDELAVREAVRRIGAPVLVQPLVKGGVELLAGAVQDPVFGPLVAFGPGGVLAELIGEASFRLAPLTDVDAEELVLSGKAGRLVGGFRGAAPADAGALVDLLHRLGRLADDHPEVAELDLNPVVASPSGCVAVDARVRVERRGHESRLKGW